MLSADTAHDKAPGKTKSKSALTQEIRNSSELPVGLHRTDLPLVDMFASMKIADRKCSSLPNAAGEPNSNLVGFELQRRR